MSATTRTPLVQGPIQGPTREEPLVEALLLGDYPSLVHLAYLILPPAISRARRVSAAHAVVQGSLPPGFALPPANPREFMRQQVMREAAEHAARQTRLARLGGVLARRDDLTFEPCAIEADRTAIQQRCRRGRRVAIGFTVLVSVGILLSLLTS